MGPSTDGGLCAVSGDIGGMPQKAKESQVLGGNAVRFSDDELRKEW